MNKLMFVPSMALAGILAGCTTELKDPQGNPVKDASGKVVVVSTSTQKRVESTSITVRQSVRTEIENAVKGGNLANAGSGEVISEAKLRSIAGRDASEEELSALRALIRSETAKYLAEVVYPAQIEKTKKGTADAIAKFKSQGQYRQASDYLSSLKPTGVEEVDASVREYVDELKKQITEELANSIIAKVGKLSDAKLAEGKYAEAREVLWRAPLGAGENAEAAAIIRKFAVEYIRTKVNTADWAVIEKDIETKFAAFMEANQYDEAVQWLQSYRRVRTYSLKIDEKLRAVEAELVKLGVKKDNIAPIMDETLSLVGDAARIFDSTDYTTNTVTVTEGKKVEGSSPDIEAYKKKLGEYRDLLVRYDCTEDAADRIRDYFSTEAAPFIDALARPDTWEEGTTQTENFLILGTAALNSRIDALVASKLALIEKLRREYAEKVFRDRVKAAQDALTEVVKKLVAEGKFEEAREEIWKATSTEDLEFNAEVRKVGSYLMISLVNPTNWSAIEAEFAAKIEEAVESSEYDEAIAWVKAYPDIRTYTVAIDGKLDDVKAELVKLGVSEEKVQPIAEETARITIEVENLANHYDYVAVTQGEASAVPNLADYDRLLEEYRQTLIRNDCTEDNANYLVSRFQEQIRELFNHPVEEKSELYLGCNALNDRLAGIRRSTLEDLNGRKYRYVFTDLINRVTEAVAEERYQDARDIIRDIPLVENAEWDARIYATRIGLLNSLVNPNQCIALCDEIDAKAKELFEEKKYEEFVEYANAYEYVHDTYQQILDALGELKSAMAGLTIGEEDSAQYIEKLEGAIRELLEKREGSYTIDTKLDLTELEKALDQLYKSILEQYYRPQEVEQFCLAVKQEVLSMIAKAPEAMTTYEMNCKHAARLRRYLDEIPRLVAERDAERERIAAAERYAKMLADIDAEVSFDSQIAMAEDAIAHQLGIKCPEAYLKFNAVLGEYARSMRLLKLGKTLSVEQATTVLLGGVYLDQSAVVARAVELGANVNGSSSRDPLARTGVLIAIETGHNSFLKQLADFDAVLRVADSNGNTALHYAVRRGNLAVVKAMLAANDVNAVNKSGESALFVAARKNQAALVQTLVDAKANVRIKNQKGYSAFDAACLAGSRDVLDALAGAGAEFGVAQLAIAARKDRLAVAQWLISQGVDVNGAGVMDSTVCGSDTQRYLVHEGGLKPKCDKPCCTGGKPAAAKE